MVDGSPITYVCTYMIYHVYSTDRLTVLWFANVNSRDRDLILLFWSKKQRQDRVSVGAKRDNDLEPCIAFLSLPCLVWSPI